MSNGEVKQTQSWLGVAIQGFFCGLFSGGGYILQEFTTGGWSTFGYVLAFGGFIALMFPLSWRKVFLGLPVWLAGVFAVIGIAALFT
jgi:hypothetical protein